MSVYFSMQLDKLHRHLLLQWRVKVECSWLEGDSFLCLMLMSVFLTWWGFVCQESEERRRKKKQLWFITSAVCFCSLFAWLLFTLFLFICIKYISSFHHKWFSQYEFSLNKIFFFFLVYIFIIVYESIFLVMESKEMFKYPFQSNIQWRQRVLLQKLRYIFFLNSTWVFLNLSIFSWWQTIRRIQKSRIYSPKPHRLIVW